MKDISERYNIFKDPNTKEWFVYDNEQNRTLCWASKETCEKLVEKLIGKARKE